MATTDCPEAILVRMSTGFCLLMHHHRLLWETSNSWIFHASFWGHCPINYGINAYKSLSFSIKGTYVCKRSMLLRLSWNLPPISAIADSKSKYLKMGYQCLQEYRHSRQMLQNAAFRRFLQEFMFSPGGRPVSPPSVRIRFNVDAERLRVYLQQQSSQRIAARDRVRRRLESERALKQSMRNIQVVLSNCRRCRYCRSSRICSTCRRERRAARDGHRDCLRRMQ